MKNYSLSAEEKETIITWNDEDKGKFYVYSSQQPIIRKLLKNPLFEIKSKQDDPEYNVYPKPVSIDGFLPIRCLTIRKKLVTRKLNKKQKKEVAMRLKNAREPVSQHNVL